MKLITVSKFNWRSHNYIVDDVVEVDDDVVAQRMIKNGFVKEVGKSKDDSAPTDKTTTGEGPSDERPSEPAVTKQSKPNGMSKADTVLDAGDAKNKPVVVAKLKQKSKRTEKTPVRKKK